MTNRDVKGAEVAGNAYYILIYLFSALSGLAALVLLDNIDSRMRLHALQSIILGIIAVVLGVLLGFLIPSLGSAVGMLIWAYGMYIGLEAYSGKDVDIPIISDFAHTLAQ